MHIFSEKGRSGRSPTATAAAAPGSRFEARAEPSVDLSVVISTRDRPDAVERCLRALFEGPRPAEIVVVDQSESDATARVVERCRELGEIVYVRHRGTGLAASQNIAIRTASREIVAVIDDDCVPGEDWAARIAAVFRQRPDLDLVAGRVLPLGPSRPGVYPVSSRTRLTPREFVGRAAPWDVGSGNNFAVRRESFLAIGGCDERLGPGSPGRGGVDMDLFYRLSRAGAARYDPEIIVYHEQQPLEERMKRRPMYGFGTGACFAFWLRKGDLPALGLLVRWLVWRSARLAAGAVRGDWLRAREEAVMLSATFAGLVHGFRARPRRP